MKYNRLGGANMEVCRGDIFFVEYANATGCEMHGSRPAVVVSNDIGNKHSHHVSVVYLTTADKKPLPTHVDVMCRVPSTALCEQIYGVSKERLMEYVRSCTDEEMAAIDDALKIALDLTDSNDDDEVYVLTDTAKKLIETETEVAKLTHENQILKDENKKLLDGDYFHVCNDNETIIRLETERNLYKKLYLESIEKICRI